MGESAGALAETDACGGGGVPSTFGADLTEGGAAATEGASTLLPGKPGSDRPNGMKTGRRYPSVEAVLLISGPRGAASNIALVTALIGTPEGSRLRPGGGRATATSLGGGAAADTARALMKPGPGTLSGAETA